MKRDPNKQIEVRMMIPFTMQCKTCGTFMYRGKKFNSRKEDCHGEDYLGIRKFRFYVKCVICSQEITFKTDPEKGDYELEEGATRNFEAWTDRKETEDKHNKDRLWLWLWLWLWFVVRVRVSFEPLMGAEMRP
ncbi:unnamed protein product [Discosporangium mesarthrocarpum]